MLILRNRLCRNYDVLISFFVVIGIGPTAPVFADEAQSPKTLYAIEQYESGNEAAAIRFLIQLGYQGDVAAQFNLGILNLSRDEQKNGLREALFWFRKAAEEGDVGAQFNLAMLQHDAKEPALVEESMGWLERAAEAGRVDAQTNLGILRHIDAASPAHQQTARRWLELAAAEGDPAAQQALPLLEVPGTDAALERLLHSPDLVLRADTLRSRSEVLTDQANIYPLPSRGQKPLAAVQQGALVEVTEKRDGWVRVKLERGLPAWIQARQVDVIGEEAIVRRLEGPLYAEPEIGPEVVKLGTATRGEALFILQSDAEWLLVEAPVRFTGWVRETDIDIRVRTVVPTDAPAARDNTIDESVVVEQEQSTSAGLTGSGPDNVAKPGFGDSLRKLPLNPRAGAGLFRLTGHAAVQEGPAPGARRLGLVASDTTVEIVNQQNGFSYAATLPLAGWSFGGLVDVTRELDAGGSGVGTANRTGGRVRIEPAIGSTIIDRLTRGQTVSILDSRDGWFLIEVAPQAGWIANTLLRPVDRTGIDQLEATDDLAIVDGEASRIVPLPEEGASDSGAKDGADAGSMITVPTDAIVYAGPLPTSAPLGRLTSAVEGVRAATAGSGDNVNMLLIQRADKLSGWIFGSLVEVPESGAETGAGTVSVNRARVRLDPTTVRDNIITSLDRGTRVKIAGREGDWLRILLPAAAGYVAVTEP